MIPQYPHISSKISRVNRLCHLKLNRYPIKTELKVKLMLW